MMWRRNSLRAAALVLAALTTGGTAEASLVPYQETCLNGVTEEIPVLVQEPEASIILYQEMSVPANRNAYAVEFHSAITARGSAAYALRFDQDTWTDDQGYRRNGDYYLVAMGQYYGDVGDKFLLTYDDGRQVKVMLGDTKATGDTDASRRVCNINGSIVEAIVDRGFSYSELWIWKGSIVKIEKEDI